jgi:Trk-type K+ transport system membrane component
VLKLIYKELRHHIWFTVFGAVTGVIVMVFLKNLPENISYNIFYTLHPAHVVLSALVTTSMYSFYSCPNSERRCSVWVLLVIGYFGAIGIATLSDCIIPYLAEILLGLPNREIHLGFIEKWWLVNPLAILGVAVAYFWPQTKFPHAGHVLLSTWASLFHIIMALGKELNPWLYLAIFAFLFIAVWLPCCISDIAFPLLFVKEKNEEMHQHK